MQNRMDHIPGLRDFAAYIDQLGVQGADDDREPNPEITRGFLESLDRTDVARAGPGDQIFHRKRAGAQPMWCFRRRKVITEVARQCSQVGRIGFEASQVAAETAWS